MFKDYKYSVISKRYITSFFRFLLLSTSNVRMSEGTFCRVEVHIAKLCIRSLYMLTYVFFQRKWPKHSDDANEGGAWFPLGNEPVLSTRTSAEGAEPYFITCRDNSRNKTVQKASYNSLIR